MRQQYLYLGIALALCTAPSFAQNVPAPSAGAASRFLDQSTFGPSTASVNAVQTLGFSRFIDEQFDAPPFPVADVQPNAQGKLVTRPVQDEFYYNAVNGEDQLRQRASFALSQIWVISAVKINQPPAMVNYLRVLRDNAFGNFRDIMREVTLTPGMGHYLDMVNNDKPDPKSGRGANENYAREILQLFTLGLRQLNPDGTPKLDASGVPLPTYVQEDIEELARVLTGWTYAPAAGAPGRSHNPANWAAPMVAFEANHDHGAKTFLGVDFPAGQTAEADLNQALGVIFNHPNIAPFISRQLVQHLVTSAPSPEYVQRVAGVFADNGQGVRGDMKAVLKAILLDWEARQADDGAAAPGDGHLREPALFVAGLLRALNAKVEPSNGLAPAASNLGQNIYFSPTVFNYYAPNYQIAGTGVTAPEFQILSPSTAMLRADFVNALVYAKIAGVTVDLSPYEKLASGPDLMITGYADSLLRGSISAPMRDSIRMAVSQQLGPKAMSQCAAYLIASSSQYQIER